MTFRQARAALRYLGTTVWGYREHRHCPLLHENVFIHKTGDVFTCCQFRPGPFGNIYRQDLTRIWNRSFRLKALRWLDRHRRLFCVPACNLLSPTEMTRATASLPHPKHVEVLYGTLCNLRCVMCPQDHKSRVVIDPEVLKTRVDWEQVDGEVVLTGGELLVMKGAREFYRWLTRDKGKRVNIDTNGTVLNDEWRECLVDGADSVMVSVNAATRATHEAVNVGSNFERVLTNLRALIDLKRDRRSSLEVIFRFTIVPQNLEELPDAVALAGHLGFDRMNFGYDRGVVSYLAERPRLRDTVRRRLREALDTGAPGLRLDLNRLRLLGLVD